MRDFLGIQQHLSEELSNQAGSLVKVRAPGSHGLILPSLDGRLWPHQQLARHNPAHEPVKILDLIIDEGAFNPEWGWIFELGAIGRKGNGARRSAGLRQAGP
jgi:hypothetical protein